MLCALVRLAGIPLECCHGGLGLRGDGMGNGRLGASGKVVFILLDQHGFRTPCPHCLCTLQIVLCLDLPECILGQRNQDDLNFHMLSIHLSYNKATPATSIGRGVFVSTAWGRSWYVQDS